MTGRDVPPCQPPLQGSIPNPSGILSRMSAANSTRAVAGSGDQSHAHRPTRHTVAAALRNIRSIPPDVSSDEEHLESEAFRR
jgi:hypothetical protein